LGRRCQVAQDAGQYAREPIATVPDRNAVAMSPRKPRLGTGPRRARKVPAGARRGPLPAFIEPSLALLADKPPNGPQWVHEIKFDGYRIQARISQSANEAFQAADPPYTY
jgi:bifunctional non-homologous end joining protein LigD